MNLIQIYLLIGLVWCFFWERAIPEEMTNGRRIRYVLFWPITLFAWIIGFIHAYIDYKNNK